MKYLVPFEVVFIGHLEVEADTAYLAHKKIDSEDGVAEVEERLTKDPTSYFSIKFSRRGIVEKGR
jgi:hypothetical protein